MSRVLDEDDRSLHEQTKSPRLISLRVQQLLGQFDHIISYPSEWPFVILYGPNGVGKTKMLELLSATLALNVGRISRIPFATATYRFDDGSEIHVDSGPVRQLETEAVVAGEASLKTMSISLLRPDAQAITWLPRAMPDESYTRYRRVIEREAPVRRLGRDLWRDMMTMESISSQELMDRYSDLVTGARAPMADPPEELRRFCDDTSVHLIETQRLLTADTMTEYRRVQGHDVRQLPTAVEFGRDLSRRLREALASNSRTTQQLDRTFPRRLLAGRTPTHVTDDLIRRRYGEQNELRSRLAKIAVLELKPDLPLPDRDLKDWERGVLWTYLQDTDEKLATFRALLAKVELLASIVNSRFLYKELQIDLEQGFRFVTSAGHEVSAGSLSSGEQHELVLAYDLLFNVKENSLVLVDEPEISLHVAWQQEFLNDIVRITDLVPLRFIVATHSPQVIHKWWERAIALTPDLDFGPVALNSDPDFGTST